MKKILPIILILISLNSFAQVDSSNIKITISVRANDLEYIGSFIFNSDQHEEAYDGIKSKFRVGSPPSGVTLVQVDTIPARIWLNIITVLKSDATAIKAGITGRVEVILRAAGQTFIVRQLNDGDATDVSTTQALRQFGRSKLRRQ